MLAPPRQLALALGHAERLTREDFFVGAANQGALALIERWLDWPDRAIALVGPEGVGKSHLAAIWAELAGARLIAARSLGTADLLAELATGALVVEDLAAGRFDERALFHLLNLVREEDAFLLITARSAPAGWPSAVPDLASRLRAITVAALDQPDDALLRAVLLKLFADRQLKVEEGLIGYLLSRMERSIPAARGVVKRLDREALRLKRPVTRALAAELMRTS